MPAVHIALPVLNEFENIPAFLSDLQAQDYKGLIYLWVCVNQLDEWWDDPAKVHICHNNNQSIAYLGQVANENIRSIDRSSPGLGWKGKQHGVGFARRELMETIAAEADDRDILISLDADTRFQPGYVRSVVENLSRHPHVTALSVPYYHRLTGDERTDRAMLRYEVYMRCYSLNLWRIESPYSFTALGSAIALTVKTYKSVGGITPKMSGEDFYFLQKLRKKGNLLHWNLEKVFPAARFSDRVYFGTGPAMIRGDAGDWSSYPVYDFHIFDDIAATYNLFADLYTRDVTTPMDAFLAEIFPNEIIWGKLRSNSASLKRFVQACHQKIDGLRILQYVKWRHRQASQPDETSLSAFIRALYPDSIWREITAQNNFSFATSPVALLNDLRDFLAAEEENFQVTHATYMQSAMTE